MEECLIKEKNHCLKRGSKKNRMRKNIQDRKRELERQKVALLGKEKVIRETERRQRTRNLIELGGLIAKAGLDELESKTLLGALLSLSKEKDNLEVLKTWAETGQKAFADGPKADGAVPLILQFKDKPSQEARSAVRALGLRWNAIRQEWQGRGSVDVAQALAETYGGTVTVMGDG